MMVIRKKSVILTALVLLLCVVAIVNYNFSKDKDVAIGNPDSNITFVEENGGEEAPEGELTEDSTESGDMEIEVSGANLTGTSFFIQSRLDRDKNRSFYIETLNGIVSDQKIDAEVRKMAQQEMISLIKRSETERIIENLIKAKGFKDALVIMSDASVNVIVNSEKLTSAQVAQIKDIVSREAGVNIDKIKIMEKQ